MTIDRKDLDELTTPDDRTVRFSPAGLLTEHILRPEVSAAFLTQVAQQSVLSKVVPADVQLSFDRVRQLFRYGLFRYDFFTLVDQLSWIAAESALGVRFVEHYLGSIPLVNGGEAAALLVGRYGTVSEALARRGSHPLRQGWRLEGHEGGPRQTPSTEATARWPGGP